MEELLKKCKYYDGGKIIPSSEPISFFWKVERAWVSASLRRPNSFDSIIERFHSNVGYPDIDMDESLLACMYTQYNREHEYDEGMTPLKLRNNFVDLMLSY